MQSRMFSDWCDVSSFYVKEINKDKETKGIKKPNEETLRKYYVYALCEKKDDGTLVPFYIGKGTGSRVWMHEEETEKEIEEIEREYPNPDSEERKKALETITDKRSKIKEIGDRLVKVLVKTGLTEYESFMCESALINIFNMGNLAWDGKLTNLVNGHANIVEKAYSIPTAAYSVEEFTARFCKKPIVLSRSVKINYTTYKSGKNKGKEKKENIIDIALTDEEVIADLNNKRILFQNINQGYDACTDVERFPTPEERNEAIRQNTCAFWKSGVNIGEFDYVFANDGGKIVGIYKVKKSDDTCYRTYRTKRTERKEALRYFDVWNPNFPEYEKLPFRENDYQRAKIVYDDLKKQGKINEEDFKTNYFTEELQGEIYTNLTPKAQGELCELWPKLAKETEDSERNESLKKLSERVFWVLEDTDDFKEKYMNSHVLVVEKSSDEEAGEGGDRTESLFDQNPTRIIKFDGEGKFTYTVDATEKESKTPK